MVTSEGMVEGSKVSIRGGHVFEGRQLGILEGGSSSYDDTKSHTWKCARPT